MMGCFSEEEEEQKLLSLPHLMPTKSMTALRDELSYYVNMKTGNLNALHFLLFYLNNILNPLCAKAHRPVLPIKSKGFMVQIL
jgi:hypothetical protein